MPMYGRRPTNASVRVGSRPHANNNTAISKSGTPIQTASIAARIATARAIPSVIVRFLPAMMKV